MANSRFSKGGRLAPKPITSNRPPRIGAPTALPTPQGINISDPSLSGGTRRNFKGVYNRPNIIRKAIASGSLVGQAPINELKQARSNRRQMVQKLIQKAGGRQQFNQQLGYNPQHLQNILRQTRGLSYAAGQEAQSSAATTGGPPTTTKQQILGGNSEYARLMGQRNRLLSQRRRVLQRMASGPGQINKAAQQF